MPKHASGDSIHGNVGTGSGTACPAPQSAGSDYVRAAADPAGMAASLPTRPPSWNRTRLPRRPLSQLEADNIYRPADAARIKADSGETTALDAGRNVGHPGSHLETTQFPPPSRGKAARTRRIGSTTVFEPDSTQRAAATGRDRPFKRPTPPDNRDGDPSRLPS